MGSVLVLVGLFCCCFAVFLEYAGLLLSPILQYVGIAYHRQNVLMTVRASSVHGMSSKKKSLAERTSRSNWPGDDMTDVPRTDNDAYAWHAWRTAHGQLWRLRQSAPPLGFPGEHAMITSMYAQVREEEQVISPQFVVSQQDVSKVRRKKRKQVDDSIAGT